MITIQVLIEDEKEAIRVYNEYLNENPAIPEKIKKEIKLIIHEEKKHIRMLRRMNG